MSKQPITIDPDAPLATAIAVMREKEIRHFRSSTTRAVSPGSSPTATSDPRRWPRRSPSSCRRTCRRAVEGAAEMLKELRVKDAMTWGVVTTRPDASVAEAAAVMFERRIGCLPVRERESDRYRHRTRHLQSADDVDYGRPGRRPGHVLLVGEMIARSFRSGSRTCRAASRSSGSVRSGAEMKSRADALGDAISATKERRTP